MKNILLGILILGFGVACKTKKEAATNEPTTTETTTTSEVSSTLNWAATTTLSEAQALSKETGKSIFLDLSTTWCGYCKKMKKNTYTVAAVAEAINANYILLALDGEKGDGLALVRKHKVNGYPTQLILDADGNVLNRHVGYTNAEGLLAFLK